MNVPKLLGKSSLMALAFGSAAAAAASSDPAAVPAKAGAAPEKDPADPPEEPGKDPADPPATPAAEAKPIDPAAAETGDTVLASVALESMQEARTRGFGEGFAAANERARLVFDSEEAQGNPQMAAFLLFNSDAKAGDVIAQLKRAPGAAAPKPERSAVQPRIQLTKDGNGAAAAAGEGQHDDGKSGFDPWAHVAALKPQAATAAPSSLVVGGQTYQLTPAQ